MNEIIIANRGDVVPRIYSPGLYTNPFPEAKFWAYLKVIKASS
jgi:hypothetical protein